MPMHMDFLTNAKSSNVPALASARFRNIHWLVFTSSLSWFSRVVHLRSIQEPTRSMIGGDA